tara:strand:- start:7220 stop:8347 length:1128 start_codon:yes stop_codon:yes gene_type:complete
MLKVITIVGTRPEIIRLSRIIATLDKHCNHKLVHTGQNFDFELNQIFFEQLKIRKPNFFLDAAGKTAAETIAKIISKIDKIFLTEKPDAILILGDTNSSLSAITAKRRKIPIFHIEAGNRCFDQRVPEEINRKLVDHISDINLTYSAIAKENLLRENFPSHQAIKIGSPLFEVLSYYMPKIKRSNIIKKLKLQSKNFFLVSAHREENIDTKYTFKKFENILNTLAKNYELPVIVSAHPRTKKKIDELKLKFHPLVKLIKPFSFFDYVKLQLNAKCVLSDSGSITEESSILNFPALNIRETHERQEGMEEAAVIMVGLEIKRICEALDVLKARYPKYNLKSKIVDDYNVQNVSEKVLRIIYSYTDYVDRIVWRKYI